MEIDGLIEEGVFVKENVIVEDEVVAYKNSAVGDYTR